MGKIIVGSSILIKNPDNFLLQVIENELTIKNPQYHLLVNMGRNTYGTPENFYAYKRVGNDVEIPFGAVSNPYIRRRLVGYEFERVPFTNYPIKLEGVEDFKLRPYQKKALDIMKKKNRGILVAGTGSGKTNIGLHMIKEIGLRALWIANTSDLVKQSRDRAKQIFKDIDDGFITDGQIDIGADITFATVQTLHKVVDSVKDDFNIVIVDEAHTCIGSPTKTTMFYKSLNSLNAQYKFGLTATPKRKDGLHDMTFALLGDVAHEIPKEDIEGYVLPFEFNTIDNDKYYDIEDYTDTSGMINPVKMQSLLFYDKDRNNLVVDKAYSLHEKSTGIIILTRYVEQAEYIVEELRKKNVSTGLLVGKVTKKKRREILETDKYKVIVATASIAGTGLDMPRLDTLILTYPVTNKLAFTQAVGRVRRKYKDKKHGHVYEVIDNTIERNRKRVTTHFKWTRDLNR